MFPMEVFRLMEKQDLLFSNAPTERPETDGEVYLVIKLDENGIVRFMTPDKK